MGTARRKPPPRRRTAKNLSAARTWRIPSPLPLLSQSPVQVLLMGKVTSEQSVQERRARASSGLALLAKRKRGSR